MKKAVCILLCIICMGFIFYMSHDSGKASMKKSITIVSMLEAIDSSVNNMTIDKNKLSQDRKYINELNILIRKSAHILEFFALAILCTNAMFIFNFKGKSALVYILFFCLLYAVLDEFHQLLVGSRTSSVSDVIIDFFGSILGTLMYYICYYKIYMRFFNRKNKYKDKSILAIHN